MRSPRADVSVVIPVFNRERLVVQAIDSVLRQTVAVREILVVDDGSTDGSARAAEGVGDPTVRVIRRPNGGIGAARNTGVEAATGEWIGFLDSDDLWEPTKVERQLDHAAARPSVDLLFSHCREFVDGDEGTAAHHERTAEPVEGWFALTLLARRQAVERIGPFPTDTRVGEFIDWFHRAQSLELEMFMVPEVLARRRLHATNTVKTESPEDYLKVLHRAIQRRRQ